MSSPRPAPPPVPDTEPTGAILWLWVVAAGLGNLFALYWLAKGFIAQHPGLRSALARKLGIGQKWNVAPPGDGKDSSGAPPPRAEVVVQVLKSQASGAGPTASLEWRDLCYRVSLKGHGQKVLLQGVWGELHSGQLMALMGPSGAGKSTLLELLAMRRAVKGAGPEPRGQPADGGGEDQRALLLCGAPATASRLKSVSSYVPQDDVLLPQMTVWEVLSLYARLRLPDNTPREECLVRQFSVLNAMGLLGQRDTLVGGVLPGGILLRGLSGGERKRLAIGTALLPNPMFLFADEPTSGLDAFAAMTVMAHLADQAHGPSRCAVLVSIHQPRAAIWDMMDKVLLLARGYMMYEGATAGLEPWLASTLPPLIDYHPDQPPFLFEPEHHGTLADWAMDLVSLSDQQLTQAVQQSVADQSGALALAAAAEQDEEREGKQEGGERGLFPDSNMRATWVARAAAEFLSQRRREAVVVAATGNGGAVRGPAHGARGEAAGLSAGDTAPAVACLECEAGASAGQPAGQQADAAPTTVLAGEEQEVALPRKHVSVWVSLKTSLRHWWSVYRVLVWREALAAVRNPADVAGRMLTFVWVAMLGNFLLYGGGSQRDNAGSIRVRVAWLYFTLFFFMVMPFLFMSVFTADKRFYIADVASRLYKPGPYYVAKLTAALPINVLISLAFVLTAYGMFGFRHTALAAAQMSTLCALFSLISLQWMFFASAVAPSQDIAFVLAVAFAIVNLLINSFFMGPADASGLPWVRKLRYISAMDWAWQGAVTAELKDRSFPCRTGGEQAIGLDALGLFPQFIPNTTQFQALRRGLTSPGSTCVAKGNAVLQYYDVIPNVGLHVGALVVYLVVVHLLTYAAVRYATHRATSTTRGSTVVAG